jgi:deferrochelatase/peroxidase EfeB
MFISFAATIEDQFEFVQRRWANSSMQPRFGGNDPVMGQSDRGGRRRRIIDLPAPDRGPSRRLKLDKEWVVPTGGGYFFAPPVSAIAGVLSA